MQINSKNALLTPKQMAKADRLALKYNISSLELMENAGKVVVEQIVADYSPCSVLILCGPGNNGGDGFVVARLLRAKGWKVEVALLSDVAHLKGDAKINAQRFNGEIKQFDDKLLKNADLIIDAIFGAGLSRNIEGKFAKAIDAANKSNKPIIAIDIPSGIDGATGEVRAIAIRANKTISFFHAKPGHYLLPGREYCGQLVIKNIGIDERILQEIEVNCFVNNDNLWHLPKRKLNSHKYDFGHALIVSGDELHGGAARLAAKAALRVGAGLVSLVGERAALLVHATQLSSIMLKEIKNSEDFSELLKDKRFNACIIGPALGISEKNKELILSALNSNAKILLDADGLSNFANNPDELFILIKQRAKDSVILTPHEGEFNRIFPNITGDKLSRAKMAAKESGAIIVLKGADTIIASPDDFAAININAPANLATAGSGDVLAGIIGGLLAQKMPSLKAALAGTYIHGELGNIFNSSGLIADDLIDLLPKALTKLTKG